MQQAICPVVPVNAGPRGEQCRRISTRTVRREDMSQRDMDVSASTESIREDVVTLVDSIITESCLTSTILGTLERYGHAQVVKVQVFY